MRILPIEEKPCLAAVEVGFLLRGRGVDLLLELLQCRLELIVAGVAEAGGFVEGLPRRRLRIGTDADRNGQWAR